MPHSQRQPFHRQWGLEGQGFDDQPDDDLSVHFSYAPDYSDCTIGSEDFSGLGWQPNEPIDTDWYKLLPPPKQCTDRNNTYVKRLIAYSYRGKQYHYTDGEFAAAQANRNKSI